MAKPLAAILKPRLKAGGIHLVGSMILASLVAFAVFRIWYPPPLAEAQGVSSIVLMLIAVDVVIGPLVTTIVFDRDKRGMLMDMVIIIGLQLAAMLYGIHTIFAARPALIVFNVDRFDVVAAADMQPEGLVLAHAQGKPGLPWFGPRIVAAVLPEDTEEKNKILFSVVQGGSDLPELAQWQVPYEQAKNSVIEHIHPLSELKAQNEMSPDAWGDFLHTLGNAAEAELGYLPMRAKSRDGVVIVKRRDAGVVEIALLNPKWK